jgi:DNA-binding HxlR family transcriptional regulator
MYYTYLEVSNSINQYYMDSGLLKKYGEHENCPVRNVVDRIGDKWSVLVLMLLEEGEVMRFNEIWGNISTISQKMLTVTLKSLEADGLVTRTVYPQIPPKVEYRLTRRGKSLIPHLQALVIWAKDNLSDIRESRVAFETATLKTQL